MLNYLVFPGYKYLGGWNMWALPEEPSAIHFLCLLMFLLRHTFKDKKKKKPSEKCQVFPDTQWQTQTSQLFCV